MTEAYSVLMSLYKKEKAEHLRLALDSMIFQTAAPDEIVLVEDGPLTNELYETIEQYQEKYPNLMRLVVLEKNVGLGRALNEGMSVCRNELIARMDVDDISKPDRCEKQLAKFREDPELAIVGAYTDEFFDNPENVVSTRTVPLQSEEIYRFSKRRCGFNHPSVMYRKSKVLSFGGYSDLRRNQDLDLFGRMLFGGCKGQNIGEALLLFRSDDQLAKRRKSWENTKSYIMTIRKFWKMGYANFFDFLLIAVAQSIVFLCPVRLQHSIYKIFLRKRTNV